MNVAFLLSLSMFLSLQLGAVSPAAFRQMTRRQESRRNDQEIFSNYIDESPEPVPRSTVCAYYNKKDECHKSNDGCGQQYITCDKLDKHQTRCYSVLKGNEIHLQGCWAPDSIKLCNHVQCLGEQLRYKWTQRYSFCCCSGDNCNEQYSIANDIPLRH